MSAEELKPCPFCGGSAWVEADIPGIVTIDGRCGEAPEDSQTWRADCSWCGISGPMGCTAEEATVLWNERAEPRSTDQQLLSCLLAAVANTHTPRREAVLPLQVSAVAGGVVLLWDAREEASEGIASVIASQVGEVTATATRPLVGVLIRSPDAEKSASTLSIAYAVATGLTGAGDRPF